MRGSHLLMSQANKNWARARQCEDKVPFKAVSTLALRNRVGSLVDKTKEKVCLQEMSVLLACLAKSKFENKRCLEELNKFNECNNNYLKRQKAIMENKQKGVPTTNAKNMGQRELDTFLKRFPNP